MFSVESWVITDSESYIEQILNAFDIVSDYLVINWVECYGKEQEILLPNLRVQTWKFTFPSAASGTHSYTGIPEMQAGARAGGKWKL